METHNNRKQHIVDIQWNFGKILPPDLDKQCFKNSFNFQCSPNLASVAGMFGGGAGQIISNPVLTGFAAQEGEKILQKGQEEINKYISIGQLKYYFAVDNNYVTKKLGKLFII